MPERDGKTEYGGAFLSQMKSRARSLYEQVFAEIYIEENEEHPEQSSESQPVLKRSPEEEEKHRIFLEMRHLCSCVGQSGGFYTPQQSASFYEQAKFMETFEDDYEGEAPFSMYFPDYQMMNFQQLRTYFTWRTDVRRGVVRKTSFSYVFLYISELINHIGVKDDREGLEKLLYIWEEYEKFEKKLNRYMAGWVKDYYIVNGIEEPFVNLVKEHAVLQEAFGAFEEDDYFSAYGSLSAYKFEKSIFYTEKTEAFIRECFNRVVKVLEKWLAERNRCFDDLLYYGHRGSTWYPFPKALYYAGLEKNRGDRVVRISCSEIYWRENGRWFSTKNRVKRENGRLIIGYLFRRIEQFFRRAEKFPYKLQADPKKIHLSELGGIVGDCGAFFACIDAAILEFYKESKRIRLEIHSENLERIRESALMTQEKLLAGVEDTPGDPIESLTSELRAPAQEPFRLTVVEQDTKPETFSSVEEAKEPSCGKEEDPWKQFVDSLSAEERKFLRLALKGEPLAGLQQYARSCSLMPEVLADGLNEKALEAVEDTVMEFSDDTAEIYEDYREELERVIGK